MGATDEDGNSFSESYFAFMPIFKRRKKSAIERNVVKILHESNLRGLNPVLKTLLIENVRVCCIVMESSGKQSVRIICASAPVILHLLSKTNPNIGTFLKNEKVIACLKALEESDFEVILNNVCHTIVIIYGGVKKVYSTLFVGVLKSTWSHSEKSLLYLFKLLSNFLLSGYDYFCDHVMPIVLCTYRKNLNIASYVIDILSDFFTASVKYLMIAAYNGKSAVAIGYEFLRKFFTYLTRILNYLYKDSTLRNALKEICKFSTLFRDYLCASNTFIYFEHHLRNLYEISKPYIWKYLEIFFEIVKNLVQSSIPLVRDCINYAVKEVVPLLRQFVDDNFESILNACNEIKSFLFQNRHRIRSFCCDACRYISSFIYNLYNILLAILPSVIEFSSNAAVQVFTWLYSSFEAFLSICCIISGSVLSHLESCKKLFSYLSVTTLKVLRIVHRIISRLRPYLVLIFTVSYNELMQLIRVLTPTLLRCMSEINSSVVYASKELISKSCLAVKRITPSLYCASKTVLPHTFRAANEVIRSSTKSIIILYPAVVKGLVTIHPEVKAGMLVLLSDGSKACLEVISVSYSASCHLKVAAKSVSTNLPAVGKAVREVFVATTHVATEVSSASISAKSRVVKDIMEGNEMVHRSLALAEQEIVAVYMDFIFEVSSIMPPEIENKISNSDGLKCLKNNLCDLREKSSKKISFLCEKSVKAGKSLMVNTKSTFQHNSRVILSTLCYLFFFLCTFCINILKFKTSKTNSAEKIFYLFFSKLNVIFSSIIPWLAHLNTKVVQNIITTTSKSWYRFKSYICAIWITVCKLSPEIWIKFEHKASMFWNFILENVPGAWLLWKLFCSHVWELVEESAPYVWRYATAVTPLLWASGRRFTIRSWGIFINFVSYAWQRTTTVVSEYWVLSETHLPHLWIAGCNRTKKSWYITCIVIENCWNFTVKTLFLSWNVMHFSVAKSWRRSLGVTKIAYCIFIMSGTTLQKSFYICFKSSRYIYVILEITPQLSDMALKPFRILKPKNIFYTQCNRQQAKLGIAHILCLEKPEIIKKGIISTVNLVPGANKLLRYGIQFPSKLFIIKNRPSLFENENSSPGREI